MLVFGFRSRSVLVVKRNIMVYEEEEWVLCGVYLFIYMALFVMIEL